LKIGALKMLFYCFVGIIILVPNAYPMEINRISQLRARAYENMTGIATVNYPKNKPDCNGLLRLTGLHIDLLSLVQEIRLLLKLGKERGFI
jgi:hypothetical protein